MPETCPMSPCNSCGESWDAGSGYDYGYDYEVAGPYGEPGMDMKTLSPATEPQHSLPPAVPGDSSTYRYRASSPADYEAHQRLEEIYQAGFHNKTERVPLPGRRVEVREYRAGPARSTRPTRHNNGTYRTSHDSIPTLELPGM